MHPRIAELTDYLQRARVELLAAVDAIPEARCAEPPRAGTWSPAEGLDHLAVVEAGTARLLAKRVARAREAGLGPERETTSVLDALDGRGVASRAERWQAPEMVAPRPAATIASALASLRESRAALLDVLHGADGLDLAAVKATHARLGEINVYQWALFIAQHEARHTEQLAEMAAGREGSAV